jgi:pimeloyl-ACP methyl ester carboxylesterase
MHASSFIDIDWCGRDTRIEYRWLQPEKTEAPVLIFLHEGLGSVAMWKNYPQQLCEALGVQGLVYSRPGYGQSTPRQTDEQWQPDFMHRQAHEVLPALLEALHIHQAPWLFGHSDGGSIALLYAARYPVAGLIILAPHIMVEELSINSIAQARYTYENTPFKARLAPYHADVDSAFGGWSQIWLNPNFRNWSIEEDIRTITCPVLAIQGVDDDYGTLEQIQGIARRLPQTKLLVLPACGHSPHRDQPETLTQACFNFFTTNQPTH